MTGRQMLDFQANRIEMVLASHRVPGRVAGGLVTPRLVRFQFVPQLGARINRLKTLSEEIALCLNAADCRIHRQEGQINIDIPRSEAGPVRLLPLCSRLAATPGCAPLLGLDEEGFPVLLSLPAPEISHVLVSGTTGSGKTALARSMITSLAIHNHQGMLQLALIDMKQRGLAPFQDLPHLLAPIAGTAEEAVRLLERLTSEMERRDAQRIVSPRIVVVVDELAELVLLGGERAQELLTRLTQRGREAGIHVVACTQKPLASVIGSLVKANFPARVVGKVASAEDARVATGLSGTGAERLARAGDFILVAGHSQVRIQGALVTEREIQRVISWLHQEKRRRRRHWSEEAAAKPALLSAGLRQAARSVRP